MQSLSENTRKNNFASSRMLHLVSVASSNKNVNFVILKLKEKGEAEGEF